MAVSRSKASAERAKIELSSSQQTEINEPYIAMANGAPMHLNLKMTRATLESLVEELLSFYGMNEDDDLEDAESLSLAEDVAEFVAAA